MGQPISIRPAGAVTIRPAGAHDVPAIQRIYNREILEGVATLDEWPWTDARRRAWLETYRDEMVIVAQGDDTVVGFAHFSPMQKFGFRFTREVTVYVDPRRHRGGVGRQLVEALIAGARERNLHVLIARITSGNAASIALFESLGFERSALRREFGHKFGRWVDIIELQLTLQSAAEFEARVAPGFRVSVVTTVEEMAEALAVRRAVFVEEQRISEDEEIDHYDGDPATVTDAVHVLGRLDGRPVATARLLLDMAGEGSSEGRRVSRLFRGCRDTRQVPTHRPRRRAQGAARALLGRRRHGGAARGGATARLRRRHAGRTGVRRRVLRAARVRRARRAVPRRRHRAPLDGPRVRGRGREQHMTTDTRRIEGDELHDYLDARTEWALLATVDEDGYPHVVPLGYYRVGDSVCVGTPDGTRKVRNAERDPRASLVVTGSRASGDWSGVMLQGDLEVVRDGAERLELERESRRQRGDATDELPSQPRPGEVILRLHPRRTITWRYN